jgi:hypothetical protein
MTGTDLHQPDLGPLRAATGAAELAQAVSGLAGTGGDRLVRDEELAPLDRAIRVSTAIAVLAVAGVAAYVSYWHAYAVVCAHGEAGATARLEPATIDGLVYVSSMVNLYAARHRFPVPALARWLLALGIVATLAANMAQGWSHGPVGAVIAAWPAVSLVGSYELLIWIIRTSAAGNRASGPVADHGGPQAGHSRTSLRLAAVQEPDVRPPDLIGQDTVLMPGGGHGPVRAPGTAGADQASGPGRIMADHAPGPPGPLMAVSPDGDINAAAVAAYRASLLAGSRFLNASWPGSSARPPDAGHATGWPKPGRAWYRPSARGDGNARCGNPAGG